MPSAFDLVGVGIPYTDVLLRVPRLPAADEALRVLERDLQGVGKVPTACLAAASLGCRVAFIGACGDEAPAARVIPDLATAGFDVTGIRIQPGRRAPVSAILVEQASGARSILWDDGDLDAIELTAADGARIAAARYLPVCEPFPAAIAGARTARAHGVPVIWDADVPDPAAAEMRSLADHCVASAAFAASLGGTEEALRWMEAPVAMVTLGRDGVAGRTPAGPFRLPAFAVEVVDTTGAGDVFHGAYIAGLCRGRDPVAAAALKCRALGGRRGIPTDGETLAFLDANR